MLVLQEVRAVLGRRPDSARSGRLRIFPKVDSPPPIWAFACDCLDNLDKMLGCQYREKRHGQECPHL